MQLRDYQSAAVQSVWDYLETSAGNPLLVIPTGGGKTPVMAAIIRQAITQWEGRVIVLAHAKELLEQGVDKLRGVAPDLDIGVYSAGMGRKDLDHQVIFAGIQSAGRICAADFGRRDLVLIDEAHAIPPNEGTLYQQFLQGIQLATPHARLIGATATPYRMGTGAIHGPGRLFSGVCYEIGVRDLIDQGYLCPLVTSPVGGGKIEANGVSMRGGEFVAGELQRASMHGDLVESAVKDMLGRTQNRRSILVFATGVKHAEAILDQLRKHGQAAAMVDGETPSLERSWTVEEFKSGAIRFLVNVGVFTTGFDCPRVDCVAMVRPTGSAGLYYQMVGRGFRLHPDKVDTLVLDYGGNIARHGPVDAIRVPAPRLPGQAPEKTVMKTCNQCGTECHPNCRECPDCGNQFKDEPTPTHETTADAASAILSTQIKITTEVMDVGDIAYSKHIRRKLKPGEKHINPTLKVEYFAPGAAAFVRTPIATEYICIEHEGYAYNKAVNWWARRSNDPMPLTVDQAVGIANHGGLAYCEQITVRNDPKKTFPEITHHKLGPKPELEHDPAESAGDLSFLDEMPF